MADESEFGGNEDEFGGNEDEFDGNEDEFGGNEDEFGGNEDEVGVDGQEAGIDNVAGPSKRDEPGTDDEQVAGPSSKRVKVGDNDSAEPTCVLNLRGLPSDIKESEVSQLAEKHGEGKVVNIILTRNKHKALVQMDDVTSAQKMFDVCRQTPLRVRSCEVAVTYSKHDELKLKVGEQSVAMDTSRCVLHVIVDNMIYPVTLDLLTETFSGFGRVTKVITFNHSESFHALIQFDKGESAHAAKLGLNGHNLFSGCCKLFIEYSKLKNLVVKYNSDISRDYITAGLVWNEAPTLTTATLQEKKAYVKDLLANGKKALLATPKSECPGFTVHPPTSTMPSRFLPATKPVMQFTNPFYTEAAAVPAAPTAPASATLPKKVPWSERRPVVLVSNLDEGRVSTEALFTLFGVYGDVIRVKVCCNTKSKALIQYKDYKFARDAIMNLDGVRLWGRQLKLTISKYRIVQMPKDGAHNANLTQDFTTSRWHRFHNGDRAQAPVVPPSKTLFLANIPPKVTETKLKRMFNACGTVVDFKFFEPSNLFRLQQAVQIAQLPANSDKTKDRILTSTPDRRMALIQMSSVEEGVDSLMNLHNKQFPGTNRYLCVSFTNSVIEHRDTHP